ncbi:MAG: SDR family NAD(P)-dependent oxidoreductase [Burkholderiaceae bacterium]
MTAASTALGGGQSRRRTQGAPIVVTGSGGGIGSAIVRRLRDDGWTVLATDRDEAALAPLRAAWAHDDRLRCAVLDVTSADDLARVAGELRANATGGVAVAGLVNVAGVLQDVMRLLKMPMDMQRQVWEVNYFGAERCIQAFAPLMIDGGGGAIVNITSINEIRPLPLHAYAPTKVALGALTSLAAGDLGPHGIRVNAVAPGFTLTPIFEEKIRTGKRKAEVLQAHSALGRLVRTDEIAAAVSFLLGDDASAITGVSLPVDAGWLASSHWMNFRSLADGA